MNRRCHNCRLLLPLGLLVLTVLLSGATVPAQPVNLEYAGSGMWGYFRDVHIRGDYAYAIGPLGLMVMDVSDPAAPVIARKLYLEKAAATMTIHDSLVAFGYKDGWVRTYELVNPFRIEERGSVKLHYDVCDMELVDTLLYVATGDSLVIVDMADFRRPGQIGSADHPNGLPTAPPKVRVVDSLALVSALDFHIFSVSDPTRPVLLSSVDVSIASRCDIYDSLVVLGNYYGGGWPITSDLRVINIADPANPAVVAELELQGDVNDVKFRDATTFVAATSGGVAVFDLSDPTAPEPRECINCGPWTMEVVLDNDHIYANNFRPYLPDEAWSTPVCGYGTARAAGAPPIGIETEMGDFLVIEAADPFDLIVTGKIRHRGYAFNVTADERYLYVADEDEGVVILDGADPEDITFVSKLPLPYPYGASDVAVSGDLLYIAGVVEGFFVGDVSNKLNPQILSYYPLQHHMAYAIEAREHLAFLAGYPGTFGIFDCTDPTEPVLVHSEYSGSFAGDIIVEDSIAYVAEGGVKVYEVTDPAHVTHLGTFPPGAWNLALNDTLLFASSSGLVSVLNVADPRSPVLISEYHSSDIQDIACSGDFLFLAILEGGLEVVDASDPAELKNFTTVPVPGFSFGVDARGDYCYLANLNAGVVRFRVPTITSIDDDPTLIDPEQGTAAAGLSNHPNPFNSSTVISYHLATSGRTSLSIYNILGRKVRELVNADLPAGGHSAAWDGTTSAGKSAASGVYLAVLRHGGETRQLHILLLR